MLGTIKKCSVLVGTNFRTLDVPPGKSIGLSGPSLPYRDHACPAASDNTNGTLFVAEAIGDLYEVTD